MIDRFSRETFEQALPGGFTSSGIMNGEYTYVIPVNDYARIEVRSSVDRSGFAADTGEDSIRFWLQVQRSDGIFKPFGKKIDAYTTRLPGWDRRMVEKISQLVERGEQIQRPVGKCDKCGNSKGAWITAAGINEGRPACKCFDCNAGFEWLDQPYDDRATVKMSAPQSTSQVNAKTESASSTPRSFLPDKGETGARHNLDLMEFQPDQAFLARLTANEQQKAAILAHPHAALRVLAGPGAGKTTVLKQRYAWLLECGVKPDQIVAVTFSKGMADELLERIIAANPMIASSPATSQISTIHALCYRILKNEGSNRQVPKTREIKKLIQEISGNLWEDATKRPAWHEVAGAIGNAKYHGLPAGQDFNYYYQTFGEYHAERLTAARNKYDEGMKINKWITFSDMLYEVERLLIDDPATLAKYQARWTHFLIDEAQDTVGQAMRILTKLAQPQNAITMVGDPDQLLYRFAGATPEANLYDGFTERYLDGLTFKLETNYRSTVAIVDVCNALIANNYSGRGGVYDESLRKNLVARPNAPAGIGVTFNDYENPDVEAAEIAYEISTELAHGRVPADYFIGTRTRAQLAFIESGLTKKGVPYINLAGGCFWSLKHIQDVLAYVRLAHDTGHDDSFKRIYNMSSNQMADRSGNYLSHRWLGREFLAACQEKYANVMDALKVNRRYTDGINDLTGFVAEIQASLKADGLGAAIQYVIDNCYIKWMQAEEGAVEEENSKIEDFGSVVSTAKNMTPDALFRLIDDAIAAASDRKNKDASKYVLIGTIHRLKGLERPVVYGAGWSEGYKKLKNGQEVLSGLLPHTFSLVDPPSTGILNMNFRNSVEDERCIAFVLASRAQERLHLSSVQEYNGCTYRPSRFIEEIMGRLEGHRDETQMMIDDERDMNGNLYEDCR